MILCSLPVRFDTYRGCGVRCTYCFAAKKRDLADLGAGEGVKALRDWIGGRRTHDTRWCDWNLPLHWGGMSDPFQPAERAERRSLAALEVFAESGYPVVTSTKGAELLAEPAYRDRLRQCNAVVQVSMVAPALDRREPGAPPFARRLRVLETLAKCARRLIVRCQPYMPGLCGAVLRALPRYADAGVHGVTVEGLKSPRATPGMVKLGSDFVYPLAPLRRDFLRLRERCHELGLRFYAAENRLRALGDDLCCCGVADLPGWRVNLSNLNQLVAGKPIRYTRRMREPGTAGVFKALCQDAVSTPALKGMSYADAMELVRRVPVFLTMMGLDGGPTQNGASKGRERSAAASAAGGQCTGSAQTSGGAGRYIASGRRELETRNSGRGFLWKTTSLACGHSSLANGARCCVGVARRIPGPLFSVMVAARPAGSFPAQPGRPAGRRCDHGARGWHGGSGISGARAFWTVKAGRGGHGRRTQKVPARTRGVRAQCRGPTSRRTRPPQTAAVNGARLGL